MEEFRECLQKELLKRCNAIGNIRFPGSSAGWRVGLEEQTENTNTKGPCNLAPSSHLCNHLLPTLASHMSLASQTLFPGPLPLLIPLPGRLFPQIICMACSFIKVFSVVTSPEALSKKAPSHQNFIPSTLLLFRVLSTT